MGNFDKGRIEPGFGTFQAKSSMIFFVLIGKNSFGLGLWRTRDFGMHYIHGHPSFVYYRWTFWDPYLVICLPMEIRDPVWNELIVASLTAFRRPPSSFPFSMVAGCPCALSRGSEARGGMLVSAAPAIDGGGRRPRPRLSPSHGPASLPSLLRQGTGF